LAREASKFTLLWLWCNRLRWISVEVMLMKHILRQPGLLTTKAS